MILHLILLAIDLVAVAVAFFFFFWGVTDGTVAGDNLLLWLGLLALVCGPVVGGVMLRRAGHRVASLLLLAVPAVPSLFAGLLMLIMLVNPPNWH